MSDLNIKGSGSSKSETKFRVISAMVAIPIVLVFVFWDNFWIDGVFYLVCLLLLSREMGEFSDKLSEKEKTFSTGIILVGGVLQLVVLHVGIGLEYIEEGLLTLMGVNVFLFFGFHLFKKDFTGLFERLQVLSFNLFFCLYFLFFFFKIKYFYTIYSLDLGEGSSLLDNYLLLYVMITAWFYDSFAYLGGKAFGSKKLGMVVSPNKTWVGLFSGIIFSSLSFVLVGFLVSYYLPNLYRDSFFASKKVGIAVTLGLALVAQFGDFTASLIKRSVGVKDSGVFLKGHGGFLDRLDSLIPTIFAFFYFLKYFYS